LFEFGESILHLIQLRCFDSLVQDAESGPDLNRGERAFKVFVQGVHRFSCNVLQPEDGLFKHQPPSFPVPSLKFRLSQPPPEGLGADPASLGRAVQRWFTQEGGNSGFLIP
jgi:hypothetical protein